MVASFKYKMRALRALASLLSTSSSKGACKCSCFSGSYLFMFAGGHRGRQVPGARGVQGEPVRDVHGRDSGTYRGRIPADSHPPLSGQMTMILGNHQWESVQKEALGIVHPQNLDGIALSIPPLIIVPLELRSLTKAATTISITTIILSYRL